MAFEIKEMKGYVNSYMYSTCKFLINCIKYWLTKKEANRSYILYCTFQQQNTISSVIVMGKIKEKVSIQVGARFLSKYYSSADTLLFRLCHVSTFCSFVDRFEAVFSQKSWQQNVLCKR